MQESRRAWSCLLSSAVALACGCGATYPAGPARTRPVEEGKTWKVFDSFEGLLSWRPAPSSGPVELGTVVGRSSHGARSLVVKFPGSPWATAVLARRSELDLSAASELSVDVWAPGKGYSVSFGFERHDGSVFETEAAPVGPGWYGARFRLDGRFLRKTKETQVEGTGTASTVKEVFLRISGPAPGVLYVDRIAFDGPVAVGAPKGLRVSLPGPPVKKWDVLEAKVSFDAEYADPFDPADVEVTGSVRSPSGRVFRVPGFFAGMMRPREAGPPDGRRATDARWRLRFMPREEGLHRLEVSVRNRAGAARSERSSFKVAGAAGAGPVGLSGVDRRSFETATGEFFYPLGMNVAWAADFGPYFERIAASGGNLVRVWLAPWRLGLASRERAGGVDLEEAERLEGVLRIARRTGLRIQLVLFQHTPLLDEWEENAYNASGGGPCRGAAEFFSDPRALRAARNFARYVASRFGAYRELFAWEIFNEADLAPSSSPGDVVRWHREIARTIRDADPGSHPVTTSTARQYAVPGLEDLSELDFLQVHLYGTALDAGIAECARRALRSNRPLFIGEIGADPRGTEDELDPRGVRLSLCLWLALASPLPGGALPWWWDTHIDPNDLYGLWRPVAGLARAVDRRGRRWSFVRGRLPGAPPWTALQGIVDATEGLFLIYDSRQLQDVSTVPETLPDGGRLVLKGVAWREYRASYWAPESESSLFRELVEARNGELVIRLPARSGPLAVHVKALDAKAPEVVR